MFRILTVIVFIFLGETFAQPIPKIISFDPISGSVGSSVTISGINFHSNIDSNIVWFGGVKGVVTQADTHFLVVSVPVGSMYAPIAVTTRGRTCFSPAPFIPTFNEGNGISDSSFQTRIDVATQPHPSSVVLGDIDKNGTLDVIVSNYGSDISIYSNSSTEKNVILTQPVNIFTGAGSHHVVVIDIDGDGWLDVVVANRLSNTISILQNIGTSDTITASSFAPKKDIVTDNLVSAISFGDIDGDGKIDIVAANSGAGTVSIFKNVSIPDSIQILPKVDFPAGGEPYYAVVQDINDDGKPDIATANLSSSTVSILRNKSILGTISASSFAPKVDIPTGGNPIGIMVNDIDGDGKPDIVVGMHIGNVISVFRNVSTTPDTITLTSFASKVDFPTGNNPWFITMGELNGDSKPDIVSANWGANNVSIFENASTNGFISLKTKVNFATSSDARGIIIGDLDGDKLSDITMTNWSAGKISIFRNKIFTGVPKAPANLNATAGDSTVILRWNKNSELDFLRYYIYRGTQMDSVKRIDSTTGGIVDTVKTIVGLTNGIQYYFYVTAIDSGGNESKFSNLVSVIPDDGIAPTAPQNLSVLDSSNYIINLAWNKNVEVDFLRYRIYGGTSINPTGKIDSTTGAIDDTMKTLFGLTPGIRYYFRVSAVDSLNHESEFSNEVNVRMPVGIIPRITSFSPVSGPVGSTVTITGMNFGPTADTNSVRFGGVKATVTQADSHSLTVIVPSGASYAPITVTTRGLTNYSAAPFSPTYSSGKIISNTSFLPKIDIITQSNPSSVAFGDLDESGTLDVIVSNYGGDISLYSNSNIGETVTLAQPVNIHTGSGSHQTATVDINGDGRLDIVAINRISNNISILRNIGRTDSITASSFAPKVDIAAGDLVSAVSFGDIDSDGKIDFAAANSGTNTVSVFRNVSTPDSIRILPKVDFVVGNNPYYAVLQDINNDGKPDITAANLNSNSLSILRNKSTTGIINASSFAAKVDILTSGNPLGITINDMDGDGKQDLIAGIHIGNIMSVFRNTFTTPDTIAASSFDSKVDFLAGINPWLVVMGELNGDGKADIVASNWNGSNISVFENAGTSGAILLRPKIDFTTGNGARGIAIGDLDGDSLADIAVTNWVSNTLSIYKNINTGPSNVAEDESTIPDTYMLNQNYPNPFNPSTTIRYGLRERSKVKLEIYNLLGQKITTLVDTVQDARYYDAVWRANVASGIYFYRIQATSLTGHPKNFTQMRPMVLLK